MGLPSGCCLLVGLFVAFGRAVSVNQLLSLLCSTATITLRLAATALGANISWYLTYVPLDFGANVT